MWSLENLTGLTIVMIILPALLSGWLIGWDGGFHTRGVIVCCLSAFVWSCVICCGLLAVMEVLGPGIPYSPESWKRALLRITLPIWFNIIPSFGTAMIAYNFSARKAAQEQMERMQSEARAAIAREMRRRDRR